MDNILLADKKFKEAIGAFTISFSSLEFGLARIAALLEFQNNEGDYDLLKNMGYPFGTKVEKISKHINLNFTQFKTSWNELKKEIGDVNRERRFITHGIIFDSLYQGNGVTARIKEKNKVSIKTLDTETIITLTKKLHNLNTGRNGINGEFYINIKNAINPSSARL